MDTAVSVDGQLIDEVVSPASKSELQQVVREMNDRDRHALIVGAGTRLGFGNLGGPFDLAIATSNLQRILEYSPADLTIAVEAGCTFAEIKNVLAEHDQMLALDVPDPETNSIGGSFATGLGGPQRLGFGGLEDVVIGIEMVLADGSAVKSGGMVVKNVTGFDMARVYHGSLGAFGVVTRLNLKVSPAPPVTLEYAFTFESFADAHAAAVQCLASGFELTALYAVGEEPDRTALHVTIAGVEDATRRIGARLSELVYEQVTPVDADVQETAAGHLPAFATLIDMDRTCALARVSMPASKQNDLVQSLQAEPWFGACCVLADYGSGLVYLVTDEPDAADRLAGSGLNATWLAVEPERKIGIDVFGSMPKENLAIIQRLKQEFDPAGRFNRGRFVAGL